MGTSSARKAPGGRFWRAAKTAATRYLAPAGGEAVSAGEVLHRYLAALEHHPAKEQAGYLGAFGRTRQVAQELGAGWERGIREEAAAAPGPVLSRAQALAEGWLPEDGALETAACRVALVTVLSQHLARDRADPAEVVRDFLIEAVAVRLAFDLGESLEAAAPDVPRLAAGWRQLKDAAAAALKTPEPPPEGHWTRFAGWKWVTDTLRSLLAP